MPVPFNVTFRQIDASSEEANRHGVAWAWLKRQQCGAEIIATISLVQFSNPLKPIADAENVKKKLISTYVKHRRKMTCKMLFESLLFWQGYAIDPANLVEVNAGFRYLAVIDFLSLKPFLGGPKARKAVAAAMTGFVLPGGTSLHMNCTSVFRYATALPTERAAALKLLERKKPPGRAKKNLNG